MRGAPEPAFRSASGYIGEDREARPGQAKSEPPPPFTSGCSCSCGRPGGVGTSAAGSATGRIGRGGGLSLRQVMMFGRPTGGIGCPRSRSSLSDQRWLPSRVAAAQAAVPHRRPRRRPGHPLRRRPARPRRAHPRRPPQALHRLSRPIRAGCSSSTKRRCRPRQARPRSASPTHPRLRIT